MFYLFC
jgi:hypothetical protein